jgi:hypothetical protein
MGAWVDQIPKLVSLLSKKNGSYDEKTPKMKASEMLATIALFSGALPSAIRRVMPYVTRSEFVKDGIYRLPGDLLLIGTLDEITHERYVFNSVPVTGQPAWRRTPGDLTATQMYKARAAGVKGEVSYEPARKPSVSDDKVEHIYFVRESIDVYQAASNQITLAIVLYPTDGIIGQNICTSFMKSVRALAVNLEVMEENPPTTIAEDVRAAFGVAAEASAVALQDVADAAGKGAAWVANQAGKIAGSAVGGFFDGANLTTLLVGGIVGFVALKKVGL